MAQFAPLYDVILEDVHVDFRASFDDAEKHNLPGKSAAFESALYRVKVKSPSPMEQVERLLAHAERGCHTAASLQAPVPVTLETKIVST